MILYNVGKNNRITIRRISALESNTNVTGGLLPTNILYFVLILHSSVNGNVKPKNSSRRINVC